MIGETAMTDAYKFIMPLVAERLLGKPTSRTSRELRFGSQGSMKIDLTSGVAYDFSDEVGGGVLWLVERCTGLKGAEAVQWLIDQGFRATDGDWDANARIDLSRARGVGPSAARQPPDLALAHRPNGATNGSAEGASGQAKPTLVASYDYTGSDGTLIFQVQRYEWVENGKRKKRFKQRRPFRDGWAMAITEGSYRDGRDGVWYKLKEGETPRSGDVALTDVEQVPYRLPEIEEAMAHGHTIFVVEGEKAADALWQFGFPATCNAGGAGKWPEDLSRYFRYAKVVILPDHDDHGRKHRDLVGAALKPLADSVRALELPGLTDKDDVVDWFAAGGTPEALYQLVEAAPMWGEPPERLNFPVMLWQDFGKPKETHPPLVKHWLTAGEVAVMAGASGGGKSFATLDLAMCVARGVPWLGKYLTRPGLVFYQAGEGAVGLLEKRIPAYRQANDLSWDDPIPLAVLGRPINLLADQDSARLVADVQALSRRLDQAPALVVVDTTAAATPGADENASADIGPVLARCYRIAQETRATVLLVAHMNAEGTKVRGWTGFQANVDSVILCQKFPDQMDADGRQVRELHLLKQKDGADGLRERFVLRQEKLGLDAEGEPITSCVMATPNELGLEPVAPGTGTRSIKLTDQQEIILQAIETAIRKHPQPVPADDDFPEGVGGTDEKHAKKIFALREGMGEPDPEKQQAANRQAWKRALDRFQREGLIVRSRTYLWRTRKHLRGSLWDANVTPVTPTVSRDENPPW